MEANFCRLCMRLNRSMGAVRRVRTRLCLAKTAALSSCKKTAPLDQSGGAALLEMRAFYVAAILIEVVKH